MNLTIFPFVAGLIGIFENRLTVILSADVRLIVGVSLERVKEYFLRILEKMTKFLKVNILRENSKKLEFLVETRFSMNCEFSIELELLVETSTLNRSKKSKILWKNHKKMVKFLSPSV